MILLELQRIKIYITRKKIKNIHLRICIDSSRVTISAPLRLSLEKIEMFALSRIDWIKENRKKVIEQKKKFQKKYVPKEKHYFFDKEYFLEIVEHDEKPFVKVNSTKIKLHVKKNFTLQQKKKLLDDYYRESLKEIIPKYIKKWEKKTSLKVKEFGVKKMKTRWGTCNINDKRIWLNLQLAKMPLACLEYIIVHEMVHLLEKSHNHRFVFFMDKFLPQWRKREEMLKSRPTLHLN